MEALTRNADTLNKALHLILISSCNSHLIVSLKLRSTFDILLKIQIKLQNLQIKE